MKLNSNATVLFLTLIFSVGLIHPYYSQAADGTDVITIERRSDKNKPSLKTLSSDEVMLRELIKKFSENISYEVENSLLETSETQV